MGEESRELATTNGGGKEVALAGQGGSQALVQMFDMRPKSLTEAIEFSKLMARSQLVPKAYQNKPQDILIAVQMGAVVGLNPFDSVQSIAVINGRPSMWGDAVIALVRNSKTLDESFGEGGILEIDPAEAKELGYGQCQVKRKGWEKPLSRKFTTEMAKKAGLYERSGSTGTWATYEGRMLQMRARSWALRDACADVLKGMKVREEEEDFTTIGKTVDGHDISMARDKAVSEEVGEFLSESTTPAPASRVPGSNLSAQRSDEPSSNNAWSGSLENISRKQGGTGKKKWTRYEFTGSDGFRGSTFDQKVMDSVKEKGINKGDMVEIKYDVNSKGYNDILVIDSASNENEAAPEEGQSEETLFSDDKPTDLVE